MNIWFVSRWTRTANFIIDYLIIPIFPLFIISLFIDIQDKDMGAVMLLIACINIFIFESLFTRSIGKMITGTKVISDDGTSPGFFQILLRTVARFIPFEIFSFLFSSRGWHDSLSGTFVVDNNFKVKNSYKNKKRMSRFFKLFLFWIHDKEELKEQVEEYQNLSISRSWKGIASLFLSFNFLANILMFFLTGSYLYSYHLLAIAIGYAILGYFVFKGNKIFIVFAFLIATWSITQDFDMFKSLLFVLKLNFLIGAFKVENIRKKIKRESKKITKQKPYDTKKTEPIKTATASSLKTKLQKFVKQLSSHNFIVLIIVITIFVSALFYWYEWRPKQIVKECSNQAKIETTEKNASKDFYDVKYLLCIREKGL